MLLLAKKKKKGVLREVAADAIAASAPTHRVNLLVAAAAAATLATSAPATAFTALLAVALRSIQPQTIRNSEH